MLEISKNFYNGVSSFDLIYIFFTILSLIKCSRKGFILSILAASKWLLAYVVTLVIFPRIKPYVKDVIDNEYVLDIVLGISIFVLVIFVMLMINKGINKAVIYSGLGKLDSVFGFFFGFIRSYIICVCIFATVNIFYNYKNWPLSINKSLTFPYVKKGSNYLIKEFPNEKKYKESKEKIEDL
jgi:membrane protein required for colicin V production